MYMRAQSSTTGPIGKNIAYQKICPDVDQCHSASLLNERIEQIHEILRLRDGIDHLDVLNESELEEILKFLCVS